METLLGINLYLCFFIDEGGLAVTHPFRRRLELWGINVTLEGGATASLKNLAPLRKEKECSAEFFTFLKEKGKLHYASALLVVLNYYF